MSGPVVLLGGGHAHLATLRHWRSDQRPVVVSRAAVEAYSGQVPGLLRGEPASAGMRLGRAVAGARGRLIVGDCVAIDLDRRMLRLADGRVVRFGLLSLDLGAVSAAPPGAVPVRPAASLPAEVSRIEAGPAGRVLVVGGGASGTELALALALRWRADRAVALVAAGALLPHAPTAIRRRVARALRLAGVEVIAGQATVIGAGRLATDDGRDHAAAAVLWAAGLVPSGLQAAAGLACDPAGFVAVDACLRSVSHGFVFAAGDGAALPRKSGASAVSAGAALARNLARTASGSSPVPWQPPLHALAIIGTGHGRGLAWRGGAWLAGRPAWWLKQALDEHWLRPLR